MSIYKGTNLIAGISQNTKYNAHHLLDFKWTDCIINDVSWLRADTFSWQSGDVYTSAYNHLAQDIQGIIAETETVGSYTVTFYRATDGHKICLADQEQAVLNIYNETGIAWYYILDTTNTQFKLPRTKYGFEGLRTNVGDKIDESLPNIRASLNNYQNKTGANASSDSALYFGASSNGLPGGASSAGFTGLYFDASRSSSTYQDNAPVQERATQMYLYFYVGDYLQTAIEQTAGLNSELFNSKADTDLNNVTDNGKILMSSMGLPSDTYIDLTLGASGSTYTAPANGYYTLYKVSSASNQYIQMLNIASDNNSATNFVVRAVANGEYDACTMPCAKGNKLQINYTFGGATQYFRFCYAVGSESEAS